MLTTKSAPALGSRENHWGEKNIDELQETPIPELDPDELRRYIDHETSWNVPTESMDEEALRSYARGLRNGGHDTQRSVTAQEVARWKAHQILRQAADKLSKTALHAPPNRGWKPAFCFVFQHLDGIDPIQDHDPLATHTERCRVELSEPCLYVPKVKETSYGFIEYGEIGHRVRLDEEHGYEGGVQLDDLEISEFLDIVEVVLETIKERHAFRQSRIEKWFAYAKTLKKQPSMSDEDVLTEVLAEIYSDNKTTR